MNWFSALYDKLYRFFDPYWDATQRDTLTEFRTYLNGGANPVIRLWVDDSTGTGHQASTIGILRQLAADEPPDEALGFGYRGLIEVYYNPGETAADQTLPKIQMLLPELRGGLTCEINQARVSVIRWEQTSKPTLVNLGLTGGADDVTGLPPNFADRVGARYFLRLQPYLWSAPEQIQFHSSTGRSAINLTEQSSLGYGDFKQRAYYVRTPLTEPNWYIYVETPNEAKADIVRMITVPRSEADDWAATPVYSIRTHQSELRRPPAERMFEVITAALASQYDASGAAAPGSRPVVVLSCDDFGGLPGEREDLAELLAGGFSFAENAWRSDLQAHVDGTRVLTPKQIAEYNNDLRNQDYRAKWLASVHADARHRLLWDPTADSVREGLNWVSGHPDRVLFIQLGKVPEPLFQWAMQAQGWPAVFEGQSTATVALNIGKPYFHVARPGSGSLQYPSTIIGHQTRQAVYTGETAVPVVFVPLPNVPRRIQDAANQLTVDLTKWDAVASRNPAELAGGLVREYNGEGADGPLHSYFGQVHEFYSQADNDKLRMGTGFLQYVLHGAGLAVDRVDAGADSPLDALAQALKDNTNGTTMHVAPGAFQSGGVFDFYTGYLGSSGLVLYDAAMKVTKNASNQTTSIETTGKTLFDGVELDARIVYTAPDGIVLADGHYNHGGSGQWTVEEIPWIAFDSPYIELHTPDSDALPSGSVGGTIAGLELQLAFQLPVAEGKWQLAGSWPAPYPSIDRFYQLAGGIDLVRALPAPFNGLAGFGLSDVQLAIDLKSGQVETAGFRFATGAGFTLVPGVQVLNVNVDATVQQPADLEERTTDWVVRGSFTLGQEPQVGTVELQAVGPDLTLTGALVSGEPSITSIIAAFAPGVTLNPPNVPVVTEFQCSFTQAGGDYLVDCKLNFDWPVSVAGQKIFTVYEIGFVANQSTGVATGQLTGRIDLAGAGKDGADVPFALIADYGERAANWTFTAAQAPDTAVSLTALAKQFLPSDWHIGQDYAVAELNLSYDVAKQTWTFSGRTAEPAWTVPFIDDLTVSASLALGYQDATGWTGRLDADVAWQNIEIQVFYDYAPDKKSYGLTWGDLTGTVTKEGTGSDADSDWVASLTFAQDTTLGSMVETMVSWATGSRYALESPWSILNSIGLGNLSLDFTFNANSPENNKVAFSVDLGPIELGFARVDGISVTYDAQAEQKVAVTLKGFFPWLADDSLADDETDALGSGSGADDTSTLGPWDASEPGTAPAPAGQGNEYLDLRMLALGQHVTAEGLASAQTVQKALEVMYGLAAPEPGTIPGVAFDPAAAWLVGADMGILRFGPDSDGATGNGGTGNNGSGDDESGYLLTTQVVFNDPALYALRLALAGPAAKIFKGLDFQVMYRQISETVGVYQSEITLPDSMRHLDIGAYSVTLPVFDLAVYTNGDFQVDLGFPWNADFSRSFTVEGIVFPGIPMVGSAGLYFGRLSSATTDRVPAALNGSFSPVLVFGLGMQVGLGKDVQYGPLKAGFSLVATGIIEGVLATFNPYQPAIGSGAGGNQAQLQDSYYFWLRGTFGLAGRLYGSIDFSVVKAEVNIDISVYLQITYESYVSMVLTVIVSVDVSVSIRIDLGLFAIRLSFSFSMRITETFAVENTGTPPWITADPAGSGHALSGPADRRLAHRRAVTPGLAARAADVDRWTWLKGPVGGPAPLTGWIAPALTVAHDEWDTSVPPSVTDQLPCYVLLPLIETVAETQAEREGRETLADAIAAAAASAQAGDTSFETLAKMVLRWVVAASEGREMTPEQVDEVVVTEADLAHMLDVVLVSRDDDPVPIAPADVNDFLTKQYKLTVSVPSGVAGEANATYFPFPPAVQVTAPKYGANYSGYSYSPAGLNSVDDATLSTLRAYFDQLAVQVSSETPAPSAGGAQAGAMSMAEWVQADYFLLLARQMTQAALDSLRDFKYALDGTSTRAIAERVTGLGNLTGDDRVTVASLFAANSTRQLTNDTKLTIAATVRVSGADSFESASIDLLGSAATPTALATVNAGNATLLQPGATIVYQGVTYTVAADESLIAIAARAKARVADLLTGSPEILSRRGLFRSAGADLLAPLVTCRAGADSSFDSLAASPAYTSAGNLSGATLAAQNAGCPILRAGESIGYGGQPNYTVKPNDCLADVALHFKVPLAEFLSKSGIAGRPALFTVSAVLALPRFMMLVTPGDTLATVASRVVADLGVLSMSPENGEIPGLFAIKDLNSESTPWIDVPHLPRFPVREILSEIQRTLGLRTLSRMAGRYAMHGTRLPTAGIIPKAVGMWVKNDPAKGLVLPPTAGLYALTGQQIQVPIPDAANNDFLITLVNQPDTPWLDFGGSTKLPIIVRPASLDADRIANALSTATKTAVDLALTYLGADQMYERKPASYPLTGVTSWQCPATVALPYGSDLPGGTIQALRIWSLPAALTSLPDPAAAGRVAPRFSLRLAAYDEATGATTSTPIDQHGWATTVRFTVKRIPPVAGSPASATTYEITGAGGADVVLLERIVEEIGSNKTAFNRLVLGYTPQGAAGGGIDGGTDAAAGLQTGNPAAVTLGIAQTDLSTITRAPQAFGSDDSDAADAASGVPGLLNTAPDFIRLLWEASITRNGGYYLYYFDSDVRTGLPERLFNDRGEAEVTLLVLYSPGQTLPEADRIRDYMTAAVTGVAMDTAQAVVTAEAAPMENNVLTNADLSLAAVAESTYSDIADLAGDPYNASLKLRSGLSLKISEAVYQAPPGNGVALSTIVSMFNAGSVAALNTANPQWHGNVQDPLKYPNAIYLPSTTYSVGSVADVTTLATVASYFGVNLTTLAVLNADLRGIFADSQYLLVTGGPYTRTATVPPGVAALTARRPKAPPTQVFDSGYGQILLANNFSILGYRVAENKFFRRSNSGMPVGPTPSTGSANPSPDKVRIAPATDTWDFHQSVPYAALAEVVPAPAAGILPDSSGDPYRGLGSILQADYTWQDYFGNTLISKFDLAQKKPYNQPPVLVGYTDALIGLSQWPAVSAAWRVRRGADGQPALEFPLTFDQSAYQGLLKATATGPNTLRVDFTGPLDPATSLTAGNYRLDGKAAIESVAPGPIEYSVTLTLVAGQALGDGEHVLTVAGVRAAAVNGSSAQQSYAGSAGFTYPEDPNRHTSTVTDRATRDLNRYNAVYYQLNDGNGISATVTTSLLADPVRLGDGQWGALLGWLFTEGASIYAYLYARAIGQAEAPLPQSTHTIAVPLDLAKVNQKQIFELTASLTLARTGGSVLGDLQTTPGIRVASTVLAPLTDLLKQEEKTSAGAVGEAEQTDTLGLAAFAHDFELALSVPGTYRLKVAGGVNRYAVARASDGASLWAVRLGDTAPDAAGQPISFKVTNVNKPDLFAPRPLSNQLQSRIAVPIYEYTRGVGIAPSDRPTYKLDFADIDMDLWGRTLLGAVDEILAPQFTAAIQIVDKDVVGDEFLVKILAQKEKLADAVAQWMIPLYAAQNPPDPAAVREAFRQQLLSRLSSAYDTRAAIQFSAAVKAAIAETGASGPPRLSGGIVDLVGQSLPEGERRSEIGLTSPKLALADSAGAPLAILMSAPETVDRDGAVVGSVDLDLRWTGESIEHQISAPPGIPGYLASSWLSFVTQDDTGALSAHLGSFPVPLVLRSFPAAPNITRQTGVADHEESADLSELTRWTYSFNWSLPFHYVQDKVHGRVEFNLAATAAPEQVDSFPALAEFVTVYPRVLADLETIVAGIDATQQTPETLKDASVALGSFIDLLNRVSSTFGESGLAVGTPAPALAGAETLTYAFQITEDSIELDDPTDPAQKVSALLVTIDGVLPAGISAAVPDIDPEHYEPKRYEKDTSPPSLIKYVYVTRDTPHHYLTLAQSQTIPGRTLTLPSLDVMQRQDAWSSVLIKRNEEIISGRPTAEPFVYTTAEVRFAEPLLPTIDAQAPINIAALGTSGPQRSLEAQLTALFDSLFATLPQDVGQASIQVETLYDYRLHPDLDMVELPLFFQAPLLVAVKAGASGVPRATMISDWTSAITSWFGTNKPKGTEGVLHFDLAIMSTLTVQPMPLLRLRNLSLALADIVPPLATS